MPLNLTLWLLAPFDVVCFSSLAQAEFLTALFNPDVRSSILVDDGDRCN